MPLKYTPPDTLEQMLNSYNVDKLQNIASLFLKKKEKLTRKSELVAALQEVMARTPIAKIWEKVDYAQQLAMSEAVHNTEAPGRLEWVRLEAKYRGFGHPLDYNHLHKGAMALLVDEEGNMPPDILPLLLPIVPEPTEIEVAMAKQLPASLAYRPPLEVREVIWWVLEDLAAVLQLVDAGKLSVNKDQSPSVASMRAIAEVLAGGDFYDEAEAGFSTVRHMRAYAWPLLLQIGGLATAVDNKLKLTAPGRKALKSPNYQVIHKLWTDFLQTTDIDEFDRIEGLSRTHKEYKKFLVPVEKRRAAIAEMMATCPVGPWISTDELLRYICASGKDFRFSRDTKVSHHYSGYVVWKRYEDWRIVAGRYVLAVLFEYAATLGLIDVAYATPETLAEDGPAYVDNSFDDSSYNEEAHCHYDGLAHVRINQLGMYCFGITKKLDLPMSLVKKKQQTLVDIIHDTDEIQNYKPFRKVRRYVDIPDPEDIQFPAAEESTANVYDRGQARVFMIDNEELASEIYKDAFWADSSVLLYKHFLVMPEELVPAFRARLKKKGYSIS